MDEKEYLKSSSGDRLYRVVISNSKNGPFARNGSTGEKVIPKEQLKDLSKTKFGMAAIAKNSLPGINFQTILGSGFSCGLKSSYVSHQNDPYLVYGSYPQSGPLLSNLRGDCVISFNASIPSRAALYIRRLTNLTNRDLIDAKKQKTLLDTFQHGHVCIDSKKNKILSTEEQIDFLNQLKHKGWTEVPYGSY